MIQRPKDLIYAVDEWPPFHKLILLGLQQVCMAIPYILLCALIFKTTNLSKNDANSALSITLIALALATLIQTIRKGPIGSGYLAPPVTSAIYLPATLVAGSIGGVSLIAGMTIFSGFCEMVMAVILPKIRKLFPPVVSGFIILAVGLQLGMVAMGKVYELSLYGHPHYAKHLIAALATAFAMVGFAVWGKGILYLMSSIFGLLFGILLAFLLGLFEKKMLNDVIVTPWVSIPNLSYLHYSFDIHLIPQFLIAAIASAFRAVGVLTTCQKINDEKWRQPNLRNLQKGLLADGLGCSFCGVLGVPGTSVSPSLVGLSQATRSTSRFIAFAIAGWLILFALLPKIPAFLFGMPQAIIGGALLFTSCFMIIGGIQIISSIKIDLRATFLIGLSLLFAISRVVFPSYFAELPPFIKLFTDSLLSIATVSIILLNLLFRIKIRKSYALIFDHASISMKTLIEKIQEQCAEWGLSAESIKRCTASTKELISQVAKGNLAESQIKLSIHYDQIDIIVEVEYQGNLPPYCSQESNPFLVEEQFFTTGLAGFLSNIYPDKLESDAVEQLCRIRLHFYI
jgi:xanthine permease XanP